MSPSRNPTFWASINQISRRPRQLNGGLSSKLYKFLLKEYSKCQSELTPHLIDILNSLALIIDKNERENEGMEHGKVNKPVNVSKTELIIAICALCLSWIPLLGIILAIISIIMLIVLTVKIIKHGKRPKNVAKYILCILFTVIALPLSLMMTINVFTALNNITSINSSNTPQLSEEEKLANLEAQRIAQEEADRIAKKERAAKQAKINSATFPTSRSLALILKDPDSNTGKVFKIWGEISQFDSATGTDTFRAQISSQREEYWYSDGHSVILTGDSSILSDYIEDDVFVATVEVGGSTTYENIMGGGNTVPTFTIHKIEHK